MDEYYDDPYSAAGVGQVDDGDAGNVMMIRQDDMSTGAMGGQSLDDIVNQNAKLIRRQSMPHGYGSSSDHLNASDMRRISMMDYGHPPPAGPLPNYQYDPHAGVDQNALLPAVVPTAAHMQSKPTPPDRRQSANNLSLDTEYANNRHAFDGLMPPNSTFASPAPPSSGLDLSMDNSYMGAGVGMGMNYDGDQHDNMGRDNISMGLYNQPQFHQNPMASPMHPGLGQGMSHSGHSSSHDNGGGSVHSQYGNQSMGGAAHPMRHLSRTQSMTMGDGSSSVHGSSPMTSQHRGHGGQTPSSHGPAQQHGSGGFSRQPQNPAPGSQHDNGTPQGFSGQQQRSGQSSLQDHALPGGFAGQPQNPVPGSQQDRGMPQGNQQGPVQDYNSGMQGNPQQPSNYNPNNQGFDWGTPPGGWPSTMIGRPHMETSFKNAYSSTGFDMLGVLLRVANRPNPQIPIGAVDLSCAFVVCDAEKDDFPIVYCSDNFERLTGYTKHMILGRNCRFLQSPDGNVAPGIKRKYVDDDSVLYLKNMINYRKEAQISLINYRRGGQPFMNLLTMIPITWTTEQVKFFVGFQVDLVEQPSAVTQKNPDGSYSINYQRSMMPRYHLTAPDTSNKTDLGQTISRDDVTAILSTIGSGESEYAKRMWDKVLLENTDDVVYVLSLKGLFQWISPSAAKILEYEPGDIIGTALSSVCHPSDIVPVTRELKDTSSGAAVNIVFRIRRRNSGYMWFEGHGSLHTEQGKGRKSIIMVGRERPVYTLSKHDITNCGGIGENELWTKMSTSGMFLYVSSNVRQLLDRQAEELIGVSVQSLMRTESKTEFGRILEHARTGKKASVKHEMINRRGQVLSAFTTLYPGDATEGQKPTFIVAQTRLIKFSRGSHTPKPSIYSRNDRMSSESVQSHQTQNLSAPNVPGSQTPTSGNSANRYLNTDGSAITFAGHNGLEIGHQDVSLASDDNLFDELKTTKSSSWQYEIRQLEKRNRVLAEEVQALIAAKKKRKRRKGAGNQQKDCANCHTRVTPEWRRGPSGQRDLCNSCGLRWAKQQGRVSPRTSSQHSVHSAASDKASKNSTSPLHNSQSSYQQPGIKVESPNTLNRTQTASAVAANAANAAAGVLASSHPSINALAGGSNNLESKDLNRKSLESHAARMEGAAGVPAKIDEGSEPD